jgi:hypothetical protein
MIDWCGQLSWDTTTSVRPAIASRAVPTPQPRAPNTTPGTSIEAGSKDSTNAST